MRIVAIALGLTALVGSLAAAPKAHAWGDYGHIAVCEMAYDMLTPTAKAEVSRLLKKDGEFRSFKVACTKEDERPKRRQKEHFFNLTRDRLAIDGSECPTSSSVRCIISAINRDWAVLRDPDSTDAEKVVKLEGLGHWMGDIHQPLHISYADDVGGNEILAHGECSSNLHSVWDTCIFVKRYLKMVVTRDTDFDLVYARITEITSEFSAAITPAQKTAWTDTDPWEWASESYQLTLQPAVGYCVIKAGECWYDDKHRVYFGPKKDKQDRIISPGLKHRSVLVDEAYMDAYAPVIETRISQAAVRLAHLLNIAFDPAYPKA